MTAASENNVCQAVDSVAIYSIDEIIIRLGEPIFINASFRSCSESPRGSPCSLC